MKLDTLTPKLDLSMDFRLVSGEDEALALALKKLAQRPAPCSVQEAWAKDSLSIDGDMRRCLNRMAQKERQSAR